MVPCDADPVLPFEPPTSGGGDGSGGRGPIGRVALLAAAAAAPMPALVLLGAYGGAWAVDIPLSDLRHGRVLVIAAQCTVGIGLLVAVGVRLAWQPMARQQLPPAVRGALLGWLAAFVTMLAVTFGGGA